MLNNISYDVADYVTEEGTKFRLSGPIFILGCLKVTQRTSLCYTQES